MVEGSVEETLTYCDFPYEHWTRIRTNNVIERLNREIRRRTRVVGAFAPCPLNRNQGAVKPPPVIDFYQIPKQICA